MAPGSPWTGLVVMRRPLRTTVEGDDSAGQGAYTRPLDLQPGDSLTVLGYLGEGLRRVRLRGRTLYVPEFWPESTGDRAANEGVLVRRPHTRWWVHVTAGRGRRGWITELPGTDGWIGVDGSDRCS